LVCLGHDNRWYVATTGDVVDLYAELPRVEVPPDVLPPPEMPLNLDSRAVVMKKALRSPHVFLIR